MSIHKLHLKVNNLLKLTTFKILTIHKLYFTEPIELN